ncbi:MAG: sugar-transfer associated ATP-grasp domain-containing protein, partial [Thermoplasmatota archaeon]
MKRRGLLPDLFRRRPNRFKQVQRHLKKGYRGRMPLSFYGTRDILTKEQWKKMISRYNPTDVLESIDKIEEKRKLREAGVSIPENYMIVEDEEDMENLNDWLGERKSGFVIKPSRGHGGSGVLVVQRKVARRYILTSGRGVEDHQIMRHVKRIIKGHYTKGVPDRAIVEEKLTLSRRLREIMTPGLADIRIVALMGFPLMAMTRLPTRRSGGKANIHQGAIGAGISISEGTISSATYIRRNVRSHPVSGCSLIGFRFNMWDDILETASAAADAMEMGFVGVDLTVDERKGVVVLEVNKRPGLEIQNANRSGLKRRIRWVERYVRKSGRGINELGPV